MCAVLYFQIYLKKGHCSVQYSFQCQNFFCSTLTYRHVNRFNKNLSSQKRSFSFWNTNASSICEECLFLSAFAMFLTLLHKRSMDAPEPRIKLKSMYACAARSIFLFFVSRSLMSILFGKYYMSKLWSVICLVHKKSWNRKFFTIRQIKNHLSCQVEYFLLCFQIQRY